MALREACQPEDAAALEIEKSRYRLPSQLSRCRSPRAPRSVAQLPRLPLQARNLREPVGWSADRLSSWEVRSAATQAHAPFRPAGRAVLPEEQTPSRAMMAGRASSGESSASLVQRGPPPSHRTTETRARYKGMRNIY